MVKRSKRLRSQFYQYAQDESGSYDLIDQCPGYANALQSTPNEGKQCPRIPTKRKNLVFGVFLGVVIAVAVAVGLVVSLQEPDENISLDLTSSRLTCREGLQKKAKKTTSTSSGVDFESFDDDTTCKFKDSQLGKFEKAAVSVDGTPCAQIATDMLRRNGSAADAAIAGLFCDGVINTQSMGLGGGFLLTYYHRETKTAYTLDAREAAPLAATEDMYHGNASLSAKGGLAVAVPGELRGYKALYDKFSNKNIPWRDLIQPTIDLCRDGHYVNWHMARALKQNKEAILQEPSMSVFVDPKTGDVYQEGDILTRIKLAETLEIIQEDPDALYTGELSDKLIEDLNTFDSIITKQDLLQYEAKWKDPIDFTLSNGDLTMHSMPSPGSGVILGFILNVLDRYNFTAESVTPENTVLTHQRIVEALKYAYAKRTELGDDAFVDISGLMRNLTSEEYANAINSMITDDRTFQDPEYYGAVTVQRDNHGTAHLSALSPNGDAVSVTSTINLYFGAKIRSVQTGIVFNDEMDDFSAPNITNSFGIPPSPNNFIRPEKRPLSSMCPAIFVNKDGDVRLIAGAAGGTKISSGVAQVAMNNIWFGMDIKEAIDERRLHHQLFPMSVGLEEEFDPNVVSGLETIGHETSTFSTGGSVVCGVARGEDGFIYANSDFRKAGEVDGI